MATAAAALLSGCTPLSRNESRAAHSSLGCMRAAIETQKETTLPDDQAHCLAAGSIAMRCSVAEALLASLGKEISDVFGRGDAQWSDLQADARGIRCAQTISAGGNTSLAACCASP
jgi:hypothetical protein